MHVDSCVPKDAAPDIAFDVEILDPLDEDALGAFVRSVRLELVTGHVVDRSNDSIMFRNLFVIDARDHVAVNVLARVVTGHLLLDDAVSCVNARKFLIVNEIALDCYIVSLLDVFHLFNPLVPTLSLLRDRDMAEDIKYVCASEETLDAEVDLCRL